MEKKKVSKVPIVKQTRTSLFRAIKANPLLVWAPDKYKNVDFDVSKIKLPEKLEESLIINTTSASNKINVDHPKINKPKNFKKSFSSSTLNGSNRSDLSTRDFPVKYSTNSIVPKEQRKTENRLKPSCRKSILVNKRSQWRAPAPLQLKGMKTDLRKDAVIVPKEVELEKVELPKVELPKFELTTVVGDTVNSPLVFKTPKAYKRRSVFVRTPMTCTSTISPKFFSTPAGESLDIPECNKENVDTTMNGTDLKTNLDSTKYMEEVGAKDALLDLHKLIRDGYPLEKCSKYLNKIIEKYEVFEDPIFWECKAAIEGERGNLKDAVEFYKTAIIKGSEVQSIDKSLEQLLEKFRQLDICTVDDQDEIKTKKSDVHARERYNRSSIIQFALKEKTNIKQQEDGMKFVVTPVRRSTRLSHTGYITTPGIKLCSSIYDMDEGIQSSMVFKPNKSLL